MAHTCVDVLVTSASVSQTRCRRPSKMNRNRLRSVRSTCGGLDSFELRSTPQSISTNRKIISNLIFFSFENGQEAEQNSMWNNLTLKRRQITAH
jgi:hypothetical protein